MPFMRRGLFRLEHVDGNFRRIGKSGNGFATLARGVRYNDSGWP